MSALPPGDEPDLPRWLPLALAGCLVWCAVIVWLGGPLWG